MNIKQKIFVGLAIFFVVGSLYGYKQYNRTNKDLARAKPDVQITSTDLIRSFEADEKSANQRFLDKILAVTGKVKDIMKDEKGYFTLVLGEGNAMSGVRCSMDTTYTRDIASIKTGNEIIIKGACIGFNADELLGSDVILNRAVVVLKN
ncbi:MAG TPA: hypothetical protein VFP87_05980 [Chitinophagaceae bacterium]|nr:hypothetical protein [Chitinophagaceae bacterium]